MKACTKRLLLPCCIAPLLLLGVARANYLGTPEFIHRFDTNEPMRQGNGMAGSIDGKVFATTQTGNLWIFSPPLQQDSVPIVFTPEPWVDELTGAALVPKCRSSVALKETLDDQVEFAVHVVYDEDSSARQIYQSRVFGIDPTNGSMLWSITFPGSFVVGTPAVGRDFIYVSHTDIATNTGRLSLIQVSSPSFDADFVDTLISENTPWGPPSVTAFPQDAESPWHEVVAWGDSTNSGRSRQGNLYLLKVGTEDRALQTLSDFPGATITPPALGEIRQSGNSYAWNVATANYGGMVHVWTEMDWSSFLETSSPTAPLMTPAWWDQSTTFTSGQFPLQVSPVFFSSELFILVAGAEGGLSAIGVQRGRRQWQLATLVHLSQPILHQLEGGNNGNNNGSGVIYACDNAGTIRQIEASNRGTLIWAINYCEANNLATCPGVSANSMISRSGNTLYMANEDGSIFGVQVATFATPEPVIAATSVPTTVPTIAPVATTFQPTAANVVIETIAPTIQSPDDDGGDDLENGTGDNNNNDTEIEEDPTVNDSDNDTSTNNEETSDQEDDNGGSDKNNEETDVEEAAPPTSSPTKPILEVDRSTNASASDDDSGNNQLYILLGIVVFALCMCVGGATMILKRRRNSKKREEQQIQEEMAAVRRWKSNKKMYEDEIKAEEEATMQELSSGPRSTDKLDVDNEVSTRNDGEPITPPQKKSENTRRSRSRSRGRTNTTPATLGSITESDEDPASPVQADAESGVEISLEDIHAKEVATVSRNLAVEFGSEDNKLEPKVSPKISPKSTPKVPSKDPPATMLDSSVTTKESKEAEKAASEAERKSLLVQSLNKNTSSSEVDRKPDTESKPKDKSVVANSTSTEAPTKESPSEEERISSQSENNIASKSTPQQSTSSAADTPKQADKKPTETQQKKGTRRSKEVPLESLLAEADTDVPKKLSKPDTIEEDEVSELKSQFSGLTEEPGRIRSNPPTVGASPSEDDDKTDFLSFLSGLSAKSGISGKSAVSAKSQNTEEPGAIKGPKKQYLPGSPCSSDLYSVDSSLYLDDNTVASPPPGPASISQPPATPPSVRTAQIKPKRLAPPDGASVGSPESSMIGDGCDSVADSKDPKMDAVLIPSIASDETTKRSNSKERAAPATSTKVNSRMLPPTEPRENLYTKPVHIEGSTQTRGRTRAGLFSRQQRTLSNNLNRESSSSTNQSSHMSFEEWSESVSAASSAAEDMKIVGKVAQETPKEETKKSKGKEKQSKPKDKKAEDSSSPWSSFLNQLAKAEEEFFNPTLPKAVAAPKTSTTKTKRQYGRKRSGKQSFPPPLPPPTHTDKYFKKDPDDDSQRTQT